jgi:ABC-type multidrug transport system fused ATPase/permease subunit
MAGLRVTANLRLAYIQSVFALPVSKLDAVSAGQVSNTITASSNTIQSSIADRLSILFQSLALLVAAYAIAFRYSWALTLAGTSSLLFMIIVYGFVKPFTLRMYKSVENADEKHASIAADIFSAIRTVLSLGAEGLLSDKYYNWVEISRQRSAKIAFMMGLQLGPAYFSMTANYALSFWFGLDLYERGDIANINTVVMYDQPSFIKTASC